ncbi:MAG: choline dehydrogenase [Verrucomicrobiota bacterium]
MSGGTDQLYAGEEYLYPTAVAEQRGLAGSLEKEFMNIEAQAATNPEGNIDRASLERNTETADFIERVRVNQQKLAAEIKPHYDFIVCGSGSSGSVVARRLAENPDVDVLLLEAGGNDDVPNVMEAVQWPLSRVSERNWGFLGQPSLYLNGRSIPLAMGKVLGGGSSINAMVWAHGHKNDWDFFASGGGRSSMEL